MCGFTVVNVPSNPQGGVDLAAPALRRRARHRRLMLTNPNTLGLFDPNILEITRIVHDAGGSVLLRRGQPERRYGGGPAPATWALIWST